MKRNKIISAAILLSRIFILLCAVLFLTFTITTIYWHFNADAFANVEVTNSFKAGFGVNDIRVYPVNTPKPADGIFLSELNYGMIYWLYLRGAFFFTLTVLILRKIILILRSINTLQTFYQDNIKHFQAIAQYAFLAFLLSCFNFSYLNGNSEISFKFAFTPLAFALGALVLAEVFKEGKQLLEDQNLII